MSDQVVKIGLTCAVIVLGAGVLGSQLSNSPGLLQAAVGQTEDSADKNEKVKKASASDTEEADEDESEEADEDVAAEESDEADAGTDEVAAEKSLGESEGDVSQQEETPEKSQGETAESNSGDDGEVVYNGIPAGAVTGEDE